MPKYRSVLYESLVLPTSLIVCLCKFFRSMYQTVQAFWLRIFNSFLKFSYSLVAWSICVSIWVNKILWRDSMFFYDRRKNIRFGQKWSQHRELTNYRCLRNFINIWSFYRIIGFFGRGFRKYTFWLKAVHISVKSRPNSRN